jgi:hypothetical protein
MKDKLIKVIAGYLEKEPVHAGTHNGELEQLNNQAF